MQFDRRRHVTGRECLTACISSGFLRSDTAASPKRRGRTLKGRHHLQRTVDCNFTVSRSHVQYTNEYTEDHHDINLILKKKT